MAGVPRLPENVLDELDDPVAVVTKYPLTLPGDPQVFTPGITIYRAENAVLAGFSSLSDVVTGAIAGWRLMFTDYQVLEPVRSCVVSECEAEHWKARFLFEYERMPPTVVNVDNWLLAQADHHYSIYLFDSPDAGEHATEELNGFVDSLRVL
jgi:hypothetical protein